MGIPVQRRLNALMRSTRAIPSGARYVGIGDPVGEGDGGGSGCSSLTVTSAGVMAVVGIAVSGVVGALVAGLGWETVGEVVTVVGALVAYT